MLNKNLTVKNQTKILLVLILFLSCQQFFAQVSSISQATGTWNSIIKQDNFDPNDDQQAVSDTDLVGDAVNAMLEAQNINYIFFISFTCNFNIRHKFSLNFLYTL